MRTWGLVALLALTGCGGNAEDFAIEVKRPVASVYAPLSSVDLTEARQLFQGIVVERSRPSDSEILYTIPGSGDRPTTIRFKLESKDGDSATVIHAFVDAPAIKATIDGTPMVISERKIEQALKEIVESIAGGVAVGSSARSGSSKLSIFLAAIAVATNKDQLARAMELKNNPEKLMSVLFAFGRAADEGSQPDSAVEGRDIRVADPDAAQRDREFAEYSAEWKQQEAQEKAAAPTSDLDRYDN